MSFNAPPELRQQYLERRKQEIHTATKAEGEVKENTVRTLAHQVLGNARTFGFDELELHAKEIQRLVHSDSYSEQAINEALLEFRNEVERLLRGSSVGH